MDCRIKDCGRPQYVKTTRLCNGHHKRLKRHGDPLAGGPMRERQEGNCIATGCAKPQSKNHECDEHYQRMRDCGTYERIRSAPTGRYIQDGYVFLTVDPSTNGGKHKIGEHRWLMQQELGRLLLPTEEVHHRNGVRDDNRMTNLELWNTSQPKGQRVEDKVEFALELLNLYASHLLADRATQAV